MRVSRQGIVLVLSFLVVGASARVDAQRALPAAGAVEAGVFGQIDWFDKAMQTDRVGLGAGARLGWFLNPTWELEGEASFSRAKPTAKRLQTGDVQINYYVGRLNYNRRLGSALAVLGVGAGADALDDHSDLILSPLVGLRVPLSDSWHLRVDASMMFAPNPTSATYKFPAPVVGAVNEGAAYLTNFQGRIGLSWLPLAQPPESTWVAVRPKSETLQLLCVGPAPTRTFYATVTSNKTTNVSQAVTWSVGNASFATVNASGIVTAVKAGSTTVSATSVVDPRASDRADVTVRGTRIRLDTITIHGSRDTLGVQGLEAAIFFATDSPKVAPRYWHAARRIATQKELDSLALRDTARATLDTAIAFLKKYPMVGLRIDGWADTVWHTKYNLALSQRRANAARDYIITRGIDGGRIRASVGEGETTRFDRSNTKAGLQANRRAMATIDAHPEAVVHPDSIVVKQVCTP
ncbi:MAG TPA: OmpA family protein [Gemmatimonadaceae bacterium]